MTSLGKLFRTTAFKLALIYLAALTLASGAVIVYLSQNTASLLHEQVVETVDAEISGLAERYRTGGIRGLVATIDARARQPGASLYLVTDFAGNVLAGNVEGFGERVFAGESGELQRVSYAPFGGGAKREAFVRVFQLSGGFRLLVGRDLREHQFFRDLLSEAMRFWLFVIAALGLVTWVFVSRRVLKRIDAMSATGQRIMQGDLSERLPVDGSGDEFDRLAVSLNAMLERIEALMQGLKEVSDNIAHDLKTPLTRMRNRLEEAMRQGGEGAPSDDALSRTIEDCDGLIRTFDALLRIARIEAGSSDAALVDLDAGALVAEVAELYAPVVEDVGGSLTVEAASGLALHGNRELLVQAVINLIENALKYGTPQGADPLKVTLAVTRSGDGVRLSVRDHGPGIGAADRARAVQRFVRLEASRNLPGSGLGLSLVNAVARLHGGQLVLEDAAPGLRAVLELPLGKAKARKQGNEGGLGDGG
ncbi:HAMP domain-containing histidine kinase [Stappia taiwanensis]|uniref:histidine kinase n=1 Tax=Stappia taiwanensis TaxID=992267 RepID=A0A838XQT5_9HYPH|nr:HAMP domain-containing sensor histidine kinase [Stappia taiwanensis]MBA4610946.1 HAMP domain-containing histidine kinase [Stappia taiwanensis]GGE94586.1 two-component sensor histidine kinase [Stappia taiwanensis]